MSYFTLNKAHSSNATEVKGLWNKIITSFSCFKAKFDLKIHIYCVNHNLCETIYASMLQTWAFEETVCFNVG